MSTLVICLVVVGGSIAVVTALVTGGGSQPATESAENRRARGPDAVRRKRSKPRHTRRPARAVPVAHAPLPDTPGDTIVAGAGVRVPWWRRLRSAVTLAVILAILGVAMAAAVGMVAVVLALVLRRALG